MFESPPDKQGHAQRPDRKLPVARGTAAKLDFSGVLQGGDTVQHQAALVSLQGYAATLDHWDSPRLLCPPTRACQCAAGKPFSLGPFCRLALCMSQFALPRAPLRHQDSGSTLASCFCNGQLLRLPPVCATCTKPCRCHCYSHDHIWVPQGSHQPCLLVQLLQQCSIHIWCLFAAQHQVVHVLHVCCC